VVHLDTASVSYRYRCSILKRLWISRANDYRHLAGFEAGTPSALSFGMSKIVTYPGYTRQSILFTYRPATNTRGSLWIVKTSGGAKIPKDLQSAPYDYGQPTDHYLLAWGLAVVDALGWSGLYALAHISAGKSCSVGYALVDCSDSAPRGWVTA
jgi:hypothetical protein